ncbi:FecR family protein [Hymenobacter arizonensis]|uniref:Ferric-dicitrate binding protein FerR, regulates iron transport through sigma-19 n=1 Tax=Hymenobacter arizonensis TaxID=1227077 RepID=A0A1I6BS63_HYMAR|nr:FecR domain-containing protein [Hymenobacter arizonensis]SFQ83765.1 ferric-dicitrate binding protein FerR, regulates iron transport through sigma-19 [Hymenobacter arizonensis]
MTEPEFHKLLQRYLNGRCTPEEQAVVERWYDRLEQAEGPLLRSYDKEEVEQAIWARLMSRRAAEPEPRVVAMWPAAPYRWAAVLALLAFGIGWLVLGTGRFRAPSRQNTVATTDGGWTRRSNPTQQVQTFRLPDSSRISLHPGSSLRYTTAFAGPRREVHLDGEAYFQVSKNPQRPFLVFTKQVVTTVLGTSFRVKAYAGSKDASVAVREGKVAVQAREGAQLDASPTHPATTGVVLLPNQQVVYSAARQRLKKELVDRPVMLAPQALEFEDRPVVEVLTALEKAYGVDIVYDKAKLAKCTVSITFYDEPLFEKLGLLCKSLGAYYSLADASILIHSTGCQSQIGE